VGKERGFMLEELKKSAVLQQLGEQNILDSDNIKTCGAAPYLCKIP